VDFRSPNGKTFGEPAKADENSACCESGEITYYEIERIKIMSV